MHANIYPKHWLGLTCRESSGVAKAGGASTGSVKRKCVEAISEVTSWNSLWRVKQTEDGESEAKEEVLVAPLNEGWAVASAGAEP